MHVLYVCMQIEYTATPKHGKCACTAEEFNNI